MKRALKWVVVREGGGKFAFHGKYAKTVLMIAAGIWVEFVCLKD